MSKRGFRTPPVSSTVSCPCGRPAGYGDCCARMHGGSVAAATAEELMRSRYSAFVTGDSAYLLRTWHPDTRPPRLDLDPRLEWRRLEVLSTTGGSPFHTEGTVSFRAHYRDNGRANTLHEHSRFRRHNGAWTYLDALPET